MNGSQNKNAHDLNEKFKLIAFGYPYLSKITLNLY